MKRIAALLLVLTFCLLMPLGLVRAEDGASTMVIKENSETYTINGKDLKYEKPFMKQDTLMSCLDPIVKTMNITLEKSADGKTITLKYSGSIIVMQINSRDATVDGVKTIIPQAPISVNGNIMVPLRFVVENFGAEVSVDSDTGYVTVTKETAGDNSIKDFSLLLKKTAKETVGDSYYNWSMNLPKDVKISYRSFNGSFNTFEAVDESYTINLAITELQPGENLDTLMAAELRYSDAYTLISSEKLKKDGIDYFKIVYKDDEAIYEERDFIKNNKVYEIYLNIRDTDKYRNSKELAAVMDSFAPEFKRGADIEDLSDVGADGRRIYEDKKLKFSVKVPADWYESGYDKKENEVTFTEPYKNAATASDVFTISMYSVDDGFSLDKWNKRELQYIEDEYDPELVKILESKDITIDNANAKKLVLSMKLKDKTAYVHNVYIVGENYRYQLYYITNKSYSNTIVQNNINSLLGTFSFTEPDPEEVGSFLDSDSIIDNDSVRRVDDRDKGFSFEVPASWSKTQLQDVNTVAYTRNDAAITVFVSAKKGITEKQYIAILEENLKKSAAASVEYKYNGKQVINDKGVSITRFDLDLIKDQLIYGMQYYVLEKNGTTYEVLFILQDLRASEKNKKILTRIWDSLKFE